MRILGIVLLLGVANGGAFAAPSKVQPTSPANPQPATPPKVQPLIAPESLPDAKALTDLIKQQLPAGWQIDFPGPFGTGIEITRLEPTAIGERAVPCAPSVMKPKPRPLQQYRYYLSIKEFVDPADYRAWEACNRETRQRMQDAVTGLQRGRVSYIVHNAEESLRVKRYEQLSKTLHNLPDYYWGHISLSKLEIGGVPQYELVEDDQIQKECEQVTLSMLKLLKTYDKPALAIDNPAH